MNDQPPFVVDRTPPPAPKPPTSLRDMIRALEEGESLLVRNRSLGTVRTSVSQVKWDSKRPMADRLFMIEPAPDEPGAVRIWRLARHDPKQEKPNGPTALK